MLLLGFTRALLHEERGEQHEGAPSGGTRFPSSRTWPLRSVRWSGTSSSSTWPRRAGRRRPTAGALSGQALGDQEARRRWRSTTLSTLRSQKSIALSTRRRHRAHWRPSVQPNRTSMRCRVETRTDYIAEGGRPQTIRAHDLRDHGMVTGSAGWRAARSVHDHVQRRARPARCQAREALPRSRDRRRRRIRSCASWLRRGTQGGASEISFVAAAVRFGRQELASSGGCSVRAPSRSRGGAARESRRSSGALCMPGVEGGRRRSGRPLGGCRRRSRQPWATRWPTVRAAAMSTASGRSSMVARSLSMRPAPTGVHVEWRRRPAGGVAEAFDEVGEGSTEECCGVNELLSGACRVHQGK